MNQSEAPLIKALTDYIEEGARPYHTPGHKQGRNMDEALRNILGPTALKMDVSLMTELDDLHSPSGCILKAQQLAATLYGAEESFFVVQGTTGAIQAMIMSTVGPAETILVPRHVHRSVLSGLVLSGAKPIYLEPEIHPANGLPWTLLPQTVEEAITAHPEAKALLLVHPTYYGVASEIAQSVEIAHRHNLIVLVDEAHGPHLPFHSDLPQPALAAGADLCAQSTHKLTGALTQCSMLHVQGSRVDRQRLKAMLSLIQTTSPNYLLMASLDGARRQLAEEGKELLAKTMNLARQLRREIRAIPGLSCFGREVIGSLGCAGLDETKLAVDVAKLGLTGKEAEAFLRQQGIQAELCDLEHVLFLITLGDDEAQAEALLKALKNLADQNKKPLTSQARPQVLAKLPLPEVVLTPRQACFAETEVLPIQQTAGLISAETITFYPPGIPQICPGERISAEVLDYCLGMKHSGYYVTGPADPALHFLKVIK